MSILPMCPSYGGVRFRESRLYIKHIEDQNYLMRNAVTSFSAHVLVLCGRVIELRTNSEILSEILIMTRKSSSNPSAKSLQEENEALKKEIESLKSEFKRIPVNLLSYVFNVTFFLFHIFYTT